MKITDKIYIDLTKEPLDKKIMEFLTYKNPDYYQKKEMGLPLWGIPKTISTYEIKDNIMSISRGEALHVKEFTRTLEKEFDHPDHPVHLKFVEDEFALDNLQNAAVEAILSKRQGIVHAVTSAGKSVIMLKAICMLGQRAVIVVNRKVLMKQILDDIEKYVRTIEGNNRITPGIIGDGKRTIGDITVALDKTLGNNIEEYREAFGTLFVDECHLVPAATVFVLVGGINSKYRFGVSGTLRRKDQKDFLIYATFGTVIARITKDELEEKKRVVPVKVRVIETETRFDWDGAVEFLESETKARALQDKTIMLDERRNALILSKIKDLYGTGKIIVLSRFVEPCQTLCDALYREYGIKAGVITGKDAKEALASYEAMKKGDLQVIFGTIGCISTGVSISDLMHIMLISPIFSNELLLHQIRGRLMRTFPGKEYGMFWFFYDRHIYPYYKLRTMLRIMQN